MAGFNPSAKLTPSQRSYGAVKRAVEDVHKSPAYRSVILGLGGVAAVTETIHKTINSAANLINPVGVLINIIMTIYNVLMFAAGGATKVRQTIEAIFERLK